MREVKIEIKQVNVTALDVALRAAIGDNFYGLIFDGSAVVLILDEAVANSEIKQAQTIVATHDPDKLTPDQQAKLDRKAKLGQARKDTGVGGLDIKTFSSQPALIQQLAQKVAWLEQEIIDQKGGTVA